MTDVIIPNYGAPEDTLIKCWRSIRKHEPSCRVIIIDNSSTETAIFGIDVGEVVRNSSNVGFVRSVNQGLCLVESYYAVLLNNDTELHDPAFSRMSSIMDENPNIGALGVMAGFTEDNDPVTAPYQSLTQTKSKKEGSDAQWAAYLRHYHGKHFRYESMVSFFCVMLRMEAVRQVGLLSSEFGVGLGDDDDYCDRLKAKGWEVALATGILVSHRHRTTFKKLYGDDLPIKHARAMDVLQRRRRERRANKGPGTWPL